MPNKRGKVEKKKSYEGGKEVYMDKERWIDKTKRRNIEDNDRDLLDDLIGRRK